MARPVAAKSKADQQKQILILAVLGAGLVVVLFVYPGILVAKPRAQPRNTPAVAAANKPAGNAPAAATPAQPAGRQPAGRQPAGAQPAAAATAAGPAFTKEELTSLALPSTVDIGLSFGAPNADLPKNMPDPFIPKWADATGGTDQISNLFFISQFPFPDEVIIANHGARQVNQILEKDNKRYQLIKLNYAEMEVIIEDQATGVQYKISTEARYRAWQQQQAPPRNPGNRPR